MTTPMFSTQSMNMPASQGMNWGQVPAIALPQSYGGANYGFNSEPNNYLDSLSKLGMDTSSNPAMSTQQSPGFTGMQKWWGGKNAAGESTMGMGNVGLQVGKTLMNGYLGMKSLGVQEDQLDFQKKAFEMNYGAQKQATNRQLQDRQMRRQHERPDYYQSVGEYMNKHGVK